MLKVIFLLCFVTTNLWAVSSPKCPEEDGYYYTNDKSKRNPRKGGFVSASANVEDNVFIAPSAAVCGSASVLDFARIYGQAVVKGEAEVAENARVYGNAVVGGEAVVSGKAKVSGHALITGEAVITGTARVKGYTVIKEGEKKSGTYASKKPQSLIDSEKRQMNIDNLKIAVDKEKERIKDLMIEAKYSLRKIGRKLENGGYYFKNRHRGTKYTYSWNVNELNAEKCSIDVTLYSEVSDGGGGESSSHTINLWSGMKNVNHSYYKPEYCATAYSMTASGRKVHFCFDSDSRRGSLHEAIINHRKKYCFKKK